MFSRASAVGGIQPKAFEYFSGDLKRFIEQQFLGNREDIDCATLILKIAEHCSSESRPAMDRFFTVFLREGQGNLTLSLEKLLEVVKKGGDKAFFSCLATRKISSNYSSETVVKVIHSFYEIAQSCQSLAVLRSFPRYDEGGEERLRQLKADPTMLKKFLPADEEEKGISSEGLFLKRNSFFSSDSFSFQQMKVRALDHLRSLPADCRASMEAYRKIFEELQNKPSINEPGKIALSKLIVLVTSGESITRKASVADLKEMLEEACNINKKWGEEILIFFSRSPDLLRKGSLEKTIRSLNLLNILADRLDVLDRVNAHLQSLIKGSLGLEQFLEALEWAAPDMALASNIENVFQEENVELLFARFKGKDPQVAFPLSEENLVKMKRQYAVVGGLCRQWKSCRIAELVDRASGIRSKAERMQLNEEEILQLVAIGCLTLYFKLGKYPYSTQVLTVLGQLCYGNGCIAQVKTGEGKSLVVSLLAFVLSMQNKNVHIISSSRNLAIRDQKKAAEFFDAFGVKTSHICEDHCEVAHFEGQILYGTATDFEFAVMREMLYFKTLFQQKAIAGQRKRFDCAIVDELDNLTIDTAANSARLSYCAENHYDWVYPPILEFVKKNFTENERDKLSSRQTIQDLRNLLSSYLERRFEALVPQISDEQVAKWLQSAHCALFNLKEGEDYVIDRKKDSDEKGVLIVDAKNTGRIMHASRWSEGIHEFIEVKHGIEPERERLMPISLSHPVFYQMYNSLFGLTGTLGSQFEREEIKEIYGVESFDVPTHRPSLREDKPLVILPSKQLYLNEILKRVQACRKREQPILVLCQTIRHSEMIGNFLSKAGIPLEILNEMQESKEEEILEEAGVPGAVTIATNTAGRGTDIELKGNSQNCGGLYVLFTFYPDSQRVEDQGRGRGGRQGQPGCSEIVICLEDLDLTQLTDCEKIKQYLQEKRAAQARIMKSYRSSRAEIERYCFSLVEKFFSSIGEFSRMMGNENVLKGLIQTLSNRKLLRAKEPARNLSPKDRQIAQDALQLLSGKARESISWAVLIKQMGDRMKEKMIQSWSLNFYQQVEKLLKDSGVNDSAILQERLYHAANQIAEAEDLDTAEKNKIISQIFEGLETYLVQLRIKELADLKSKIEVLYDEHKTEWERYFHASGSGIFQFLGDITQIKFCPN